jgi:hypothetical protein
VNGLALVSLLGVLLPTTGCMWQAERPEVTGIVRDRDTLEPLGDVQVRIEVASRGEASPVLEKIETRTNQWGRFYVREKRTYHPAYPLALSTPPVRVRVLAVHPGHNEASVQLDWVSMHSSTDGGAPSRCDVGTIELSRRP